MGSRVSGAALDELIRTELLSLALGLHCHGGARAVRGRASPCWKEDGPRSLAGGAERRKRAYRFASWAGPRGGREERTGPRGKKGKGPSSLKDFSHLNKQSTFKSFVEQKKNNQIT